MKQIIVDDEMARMLGSARGFVEIKDPDGKHLGMFVGGTREEALLYLHAWSTIDPKAIEKQLNTPEKTYTIDEVYAHLKSLEGK
jgi:hypothetical protein